MLANDDGLTSNLVALYQALEDAGHDVIVSVPCRNQSGQGAAITIGTPITPLETPCLNDAAPTGAPGVGPMQREGLPEGDFHYVDGTPIMAVMYGLDVLAMERWGTMPDIVLSGPNEGQNVGAIAISSGTVNAAQFASLRGLPAIALSAGSNSESDTLDNPVSVAVAAKTVELLETLDAKAGDGPLLPRHILLNVNFPNDLEGAQWRSTRVGTFNIYQTSFTENAAQDATPMMRMMAEAREVDIPPLPAILFGFNTEEPEPGEERDEAFVFRQHIAVSPMQAGYAGSTQAEAVVAWQLSDLLEAGEE